jgi:beta-phosphoglucomutase
VEDSAAGVVAAKAAGMRSLGVGPEYKELEADYEALNFNSNIHWDNLLKA